MAQAAPVRNGKETKVLLTTREKGTNLIGNEPGTYLSFQNENISTTLMSV